MKVGLMLHDNIWYCPYVSLYTNLLEKKSIDFDIIYWNKEGLTEGGISYNYLFSNDSNNLLKLWGYIKFSMFLRKTLKKNQYEKLVVFGPQIAIFLYPLLKKKYNYRFIFDYRDLSIENRFPHIFKKMLSISALNVISSPGFKKCLPSGFNYVLSHNVNPQTFNNDNNYSLKIPIKKPIVILTIGAIRNYKSNQEVIAALGNDKRFELRFVGKGPSEVDLKRYVMANKIDNVKFYGYYKKEDEYKYVEEADFINIFYPLELSHTTNLSNRFYLSLYYCKPMITTIGTVHGDYVSKYRIGITINNCNNLANDIFDFMDKNSYEYMIGRNNVMNKIKKDIRLFEDSVLHFLQSE